MNSRTQSPEPMACPRCGTTMNHHADKRLYLNDSDESRPTDPITGGFVEEMHTCPKCGAGASRGVPMSRDN